MISLCEAAQAWLEQVTYQMNKMSYKQQSQHLAGQIAFLKSWSTRVSHECADNAVQIFGGRALTKSGMGRFIEEFHRTYKFDAVLGGSEEVLADLGVRQALRFVSSSLPVRDSLLAIADWFCFVDARQLQAVNGLQLFPLLPLLPSFVATTLVSIQSN